MSTPNNTTMSLTSILKENALKTKFKQNFPVPKIKLDGSIIAPPQTTHYSMMGTAFDYVLRFHLERVFPDAVTRQLVAETAVNHIRCYSGEYALVDDVAVKVDSNQERDEKYCYINDLFPNAKCVVMADGNHEFKKMIKPAETVLETALENVKGFHKTGIIKDLFLESCLSLARLDVVLRTGTLFPETIVSSEDKRDLADLRRLLAVAKKVIPKPKHRLLLNPLFTKSGLVGGADADMILDDTLIDIKTTKSLKFTQEMYSQLLGYYALDTGKRKITHIGIYFSRYGIYHTVPVPTGTKKILSWFKDYRVTHS